LQKLGFLSRTEMTNKRQEKPTQPPVDIEVVDLCFNFLKDFMEIEGLFRISGETAAVKEIFDSFAHPITFPPKTSPHSVSSAFKQWLRSIDPPIIPHEVFNEAYAAYEIKDVQAMSKLLANKVTPLNYQILEKLVSFLVQLADKSSVNKMDFRNIGIVFGPSLLPLELPEDNPIAAIQLQMKTVRIFEFILLNNKLLFKKE